MKIRELLKNGIDRLNKYGVEDGILRTRILLAYEMGVRNEYLGAHMDDEIGAEVAEKFCLNVDEIIAGRPIQYITNSQDFYGLTFFVDENVLIPQPDTEILVEEVIRLAKDMNVMRKILDICTGSGAIAVALAKNIEAEVWASDISKNALEIAKKNAADNGANVEFVEADMFGKIEGKYDIIVSNPPYIETETIKELSEEVKNEPLIALDGGEDGLDFYRILADKSREHLKYGGILAVEIGYNQKEAVMQMFEKCGFVEVYSKKDFGNNDRIVVGKWR